MLNVKASALKFVQHNVDLRSYGDVSMAPRRTYCVLQRTFINLVHFKSKIKRLELSVFVILQTILSLNVILGYSSTLFKGIFGIFIHLFLTVS